MIYISAPIQNHLNMLRCALDSDLWNRLESIDLGSEVTWLILKGYHPCSPLPNHLEIDMCTFPVVQFMWELRLLQQWYWHRMGLLWYSSAEAIKSYPSRNVMPHSEYLLHISRGWRQMIAQYMAWGLHKAYIKNI